MNFNKNNDFYLNLLSFLNADDWICYFQSPASEHAQALFDFHNYVMFFLVMIVTFVVWLIRLTLVFVVNFTKKQYYAESKSPITTYFYPKNNFQLFENAQKISNWRFFEILTDLDRKFVRALFVNFITLKNKDFFFSSDKIATYAYCNFFRDFFLMHNLMSYSSFFDVKEYGIFYYDSILSRVHNETLEIFDYVVLSQLKLNTYIKMYKFLAIINDEKIVDPLCEIDDPRLTDNLIIRLMSWKKSKYFQNNWIYNHFFSEVIKKKKNFKNYVKTYSISYLFPSFYYGNVWLRKKKGSSTRLFKRFLNFKTFKYLKLLTIYFDKSALASVLRFQQFKHNTELEVVWTVLPSLILLFILVPSLLLLYGYDRPYVTNPYLTFKAIGHQWFWSYEYSDDINFRFNTTSDELMLINFEKRFKNFEFTDEDHNSIFTKKIYNEDFSIFNFNLNDIMVDYRLRYSCNNFYFLPSFRMSENVNLEIFNEIILKKLKYKLDNFRLKSIIFDSYMIHEDSLEKGQLRLLETDNRIVLPTGFCTRVITTSTDVLHSWCVPALGLKMDSVPGRLNQQYMILNRPGVYYGQCSELCGVGHGFMPIMVEVVRPGKFLKYLNNNYLSQLNEFIKTLN